LHEAPPSRRFGALGALVIARAPWLG